MLTRLMLQQQQFSSWECLGCLSSRKRCKFTQSPCSESKRRCSSLERPKACSLREAGARALPSPTAGRSLRLPPSDFGQLLRGYLNPGCPRCPSEHNGIISLLTLFPQHSPFLSHRQDPLHLPEQIQPEQEHGGSSGQEPPKTFKYREEHRGRSKPEPSHPIFRVGKSWFFCPAGGI